MALHPSPFLWEDSAPRPQRLLRAIGRLAALDGKELNEADLVCLEAAIERVEGGSRLDVAKLAHHNSAWGDPGTPSTGDFCCNSDAHSVASWGSDVTHMDDPTAWLAGAARERPATAASAALPPGVAGAALRGQCWEPLEPEAPKRRRSGAKGVPGAEQEATELRAGDTGPPAPAPAPTVDVDVTVPEDALEEGTVSVDYGGFRYEVQVPRGCSKGSTFRVALLHPPQ